MADDSGGGGGARERAARALRESRAERFFALVDGKEREVRAAKTRGRWERLHDAAHALGASSIECRDEDGATLAVVQLGEQLEPLLEEDDQAQQLEQLPLRARSSADEVERLLTLVLRAQDAAVARQGEQVRQVTDAALSVMNAAAERASSMERAVLALVQQRERELAAVSEQLHQDARALERADRAQRAQHDAEREEDGELDGMVKKLIDDAVTPAIGAKIMAAMNGKKAS